MKINKILFEVEEDDGHLVALERIKTENVSVNNHCDGCHFKNARDADKYGRCPMIETGMKICQIGYIFKDTK
jgi:hypothetical protein